MIVAIWTLELSQVNRLKKEAPKYHDATLDYIDYLLAHK